MDATKSRSGTSRFATAEALSREDMLAVELRSLPRPSRLERAVALQGAAAGAAAALGIETVGDLLEHFPHSHRDRREVKALGALAAEEQATVEVTVRSVAVRPMRNRRQKRVEARVADASGPSLAIWFNQPWVASQLGAGTRLRLHGTLKPRNRFWVSEHEVVGGGGAIHASGLVPIHPATDKLSSAKLRELIDEARALARHAVEPLPAALRVAERLPDRAAALDAIHFPGSPDDEEEARRRLAFEELLLFELALAARRLARARATAAQPVRGGDELIRRWLRELPFEPTSDQADAFARIDADLGADHPMQRLLMGEVGSGKTVVALHAMLRAIESGGQAALMAPTETLAEQHLATLDRLLGGLTPIALLTGSTARGARRETLARLASGQLGLVVGTHALIEPAVEFRELALCVVDEQHRFGVSQRAALDAKAPAGLVPHVLHLTATPIPRTLALTAFGDLDVTALRELPAGRGSVETHVVDGTRPRARAYERIREEIARGRQCFVVCPLVEESETLQAKAATTEAERLARTEFRDQHVELIHGQMPAREKASAMRAFAAGEADVLVATSVIEVGIDVPNATVMVIEAAERYGLSQLHQLRGRIGRGPHPSLCILFGDADLPRLRAIADEPDGFRLAEVDLELRGAGEVLGTRQHGLPQFRVARLPSDAALLDRTRDAARRLIADDVALARPEHALLRDTVAARFGPEQSLIPA